MTETQTVLPVSGMTCPNCDIAVERALRRLPGIVNVAASFATGLATIDHQGDLDHKAVDTALQEEGYSLTGAKARPRFIEAGAAFVVVLAILLASRHFGWPHGLSVTDNMSLGFVFLIGLLASVSSCIAVTGGLLLAIAAKYNETMAGASASQRFIPHLYFNAGRVISYTAFGAAIGFVGSALTLSPAISGVLTIAVSVMMILVGLQMLGLLPRVSRIIPGFPKAFLHRIHDLAAKTSRGSAFALGAATFFLPCGFTIALQLYVLGKADALTGALTMLVFAIGTLPALLGLSMLSSFARGSVQARFLTIAGAVVVVLGFMNIQFGLVQLDAASPARAEQTAAQTAQPPMTQWRQIVEMKVVGLEYQPNRFTVKTGVPVEWRIDGREAEGCGRILVSRSLGLQKFLSSDGPSVITFTPTKAGEYAFNCSMGMMTPNSAFTVVN